MVAGCHKAAPATSVKNPIPVVSTNVLVQYRYEWNYKTLVEPYGQAGHTSPKWDEPAQRALTEFARVRAGCLATNENSADIIASNCTTAVDAGCDDPLVKYLFIRYSLSQTNNAKVFTEAYCQVAKDIQDSAYPPVRKFYAAARALDQILYTYGTNTSSQSAWGEMTPFIGPNVQAALSDKTMPAREAYEIAKQALQLVSGDTKGYEQAYNCVEQPLTNNWPDDYTTPLLKGTAYIQLAWLARGNGYANTVSEQGWKLFNERLATAQAALEHAWELNPKDPEIAHQMMTVMLGQGGERAQMELWFNRAMALNPDDYEACSKKLYYLEPKWYGSEDDLLTFGWECSESKAWGGKVPLILLDAHEAIYRYLNDSEKTNYWKQPDVWLDIQSAFDRFFTLNPDATGWYHNYAWYAYHCERWQKLNQLIPKLDPVNYSYFGGKPAFDKMVSQAREHAGDTNPETLTPALEFKRLLARIRGEVNEGKTNEADYKDEFKALDALLAKQKDEKTNFAAQILFTEAALYLQLFNDFDKSTQLIKQLKADFPGTKQALAADQFLAQIQKQNEAKKINDALSIGTPFPDFNEKDLAGHPLSIANLKSKVVLVDFWATWCGPCVAEMPNVVATYDKYHDRGFDIVGISLDEDQAKLTAFIKEKNIIWPQYFDGQGWSNKLALKCGIESIPATFLLDGNGKIIGKDLRGEQLVQAVGKAVTNN